MLICEDCGRVHTDDYFADDFYAGDECTKCGGALVEAEECDWCGGYRPKSEMFCIDCEDKMVSAENVMYAAAGAGDEPEIKVNGFALLLLGESGIRDAIAEAVKNTCDKEVAKVAREYMKGFDPEGYTECLLAGRKGTRV